MMEDGEFLPGEYIILVECDVMMISKDKIYEIGNMWCDMGELVEDI
jgi:hypothetical protein